MKICSAQIASLGRKIVANLNIIKYLASIPSGYVLPIEKLQSSPFYSSVLYKKCQIVEIFLLLNTCAEKSKFRSANQNIAQTIFHSRKWHTNCGKMARGTAPEVMRSSGRAPNSSEPTDRTGTTAPGAGGQLQLLLTKAEDLKVMSRDPVHVVRFFSGFLPPAACSRVIHEHETVGI